jgi:rhodanese-related sulfurtransferase
MNLPLCLKAISFLLTKFNQFILTLFIATATVAAHAQVALLFGDLTWLRINAYLDKEYPDVGNISTSELAPKTGINLFDTRTLDEFKASRLPNAKHYDSSKAIVAGLSKDSAIVVYCSVGLRSASIAKKLQADGYTNVKNLRGSAFMWANEGLPLEGPSAPFVHPYNARWGALLNASVRLKL